jgi:hypothetical protein
MTAVNGGLAASGVLLTTCHLRRDGISDLQRLVASSDAAARTGEVGDLRHLILVQGCSSVERGKLAKQLPDWIDIIATPASLSSPQARNLLIRHLLESDAFDPAAFVAFPDDDAWYPLGALACVARHFAKPSDIQLLLCRYGPSPSPDQCNRASPATLQRALTSGACATIFVRASLLAELGGFHPLLGLGTKLRGGEDTEFVHRAFHRSRGKVIVIKAVLVGHAAADRAHKAQYYEGALSALLAHSGASAEARLALARKLAVGLWLVLKNYLSLPQYLAALGSARANAASLRQGPELPNTDRPTTFG